MYLGCLINIQCSNNAVSSPNIEFGKIHVYLALRSTQIKKQIQLTFLAGTSNRNMKLVM